MLQPKEESLSSRQWTRYVCLLAIACVLAVPAFAQVDQGKITGTVKDSTGAVIPGVSITVLNVRTAEERTALTGDRGDYLVIALKPSTYTLRASLAGFAPAEVTGIQLGVGQSLSIDLSIKPAG